MDLARRFRVLVRRVLRRVRRLWRSSILVRVLVTSQVLGLVTIGLVGLYVAYQTRDGLFEARVQQALDESARSSARAQASLDASTASGATEVQQLLYDVVTAENESGAGQRGVVLLREPGQTNPFSVRYTASDAALVDVVSDQMRQTVVDGAQHWQSVALPVGSGTVPGLVVGQQVSVPAAGEYQLFYIYSLQPEQDRLDFLLRTFAFAALALAALVGAMSFVVTRQTVRPVMLASQVAAKFAEGYLDQRMEVRGSDEMATMARAFNEMASSLSNQITRMEELSTLQRRFVSDVSHELRTPLTTVRMAAELIYEARDEFDPTLRRSTELLAAQLDRFEDLLADLLEISRFDAGAAVLDAHPSDMAQVVRDVVEAVSPLAERKGSQWVLRTPEETAIADIDPRRVERILRNLLVNAVEHADGTPVEIDVRADNRAVCVRVRDHGIGMDAEQVRHVFDRFWRADPARARTTGGTGLGLAIAVEDARLHGGRLEAWGRPGRGASFLLTLPLRAGISLITQPMTVEPDPEPGQLQTRSVTDPAALPYLDPETGALPIVRSPRGDAE